MADYFDQAGTGLDQGKAALLQAIATQGSQAHAAIQAGQDQIASAKQAAIAQALAGARQRGAPQPELDQLTSTVSQPYDAQLSALASSQASRDAGFAQQNSAAGTYMDQARAGLPALRTQLAQKVATLQAQARASEGAQQFQLEQSRISAQNQAATQDLERQRLQLELAKAQHPDLGSIISQLGGADLAGAQLSGALSQGANSIDRSIGRNEQGGNMDVESITSGLADKQALPDTIGSQIGLPGPVVSQLGSLYDQKQGAAATAADKQAGIDADSAAYAKGAAFAAKAAAQQGETAQQFAADVNAIPGMTPVAAAKIISEYGHLFPNTAAPGYVPLPGIGGKVN